MAGAVNSVHAESEMERSREVRKRFIIILILAYYEMNQTLLSDLLVSNTTLSNQLKGLK